MRAITITISAAVMLFGFFGTTLGQSYSERHVYAIDNNSVRAPEPPQIVQVNWPESISAPKRLVTVDEGPELEWPHSETLRNGRADNTELMNYRTVSGSLLQEFENDEPLRMPLKTNEDVKPKPDANSGSPRSTSGQGRIPMPIPSNSELFPLGGGENNDSGIDYQLGEGEWITDDGMGNGSGYYDGYDYSGMMYGGMYQQYGHSMDGYIPGMVYGSEHGPVSQWLLDNSTVFGGAKVLSDDMNLRHKGNFGLSAGANWAGPALIPLQITGQFGIQAVYSNLNDSNALPDYYYGKSSSRTQLYATGGFYKRLSCFPIQAGIVYDWCLDDTYQSIQLGQIRTELSLWTQTGIEFGFRGTFGLESKDITLVRYDPFEKVDYYENYEIKPRNFYSLFGKMYHATGANGSAILGMSDDSDYRFGLEYEVPISQRFTARSGISYSYMDKRHEVTGEKRENWDFWLTFTYYPHGHAFNGIHNPLRAMFDVADSTKMSPKFEHRGTYRGP